MGVYFSGILHRIPAHLAVLQAEIRQDSNYGGHKLGASPDLILDGQQRITAIYYAVESPDAPLPNTETAYKFFLDINAVLDPTRDPSEIIFPEAQKKQTRAAFTTPKCSTRKRSFR